MEFLKSQKRFDFLYDEIPFGELACQVTSEENGNTLTTVYRFPDGLQITNCAQKKGNAYEWVNWLENTGEQPSKIISQLWDCCVALPMPYEEKPKNMAAVRFQDITAVYAPIGSILQYDEFCSFPDRKTMDHYEGHLAPGEVRRYATSGGRSSEAHAPYFHIHKDGVGYICAIGWSGQWNCELTRTADTVIVKSKIQDTHFRLLPGEKIRTSSFVLMPYEGTVVQAHNLWRRLMREYYCPIGKPGRDTQGPLSCMVWGGDSSREVLDALEKVKEYGLSFEYLWMDAGWYSTDLEKPSDHREDWYELVGDWQVNPRLHPGGLKDVADAGRQAGMEFMLWFEPERASNTVPLTKEHPEYFIPPICAKNHTVNLGEDAGWNYVYSMLCEKIEALGIRCYRQDYNDEPVTFWQSRDAEDRQGITEIRHICGLYRLWDALLERFPNLLIDNCAAGGRRLDIELLRRSIPLHRTDFVCCGAYNESETQCHHQSFNMWMPYSGSAPGYIFGDYEFRSAYSPCFCVDLFEAVKDPERIPWLKARLEEYRRIRPLMEEDFYPLTSVSDRPDVWMASQFDRPSHNDGVVQIFRREESPYETATFTLGGLDEAYTYVFTNADTGERMSIPGKTLIEQGLSVAVKERRSAKILFYEKYL